MYEDQNHGLFSKRLAEWAISNMEIKDASGLSHIKERSLSDVEGVLSENHIDMPTEFIYTAWYLFNMAIADYPESLTTDEQRAKFVKETISDPDCCPEAVLECFIAKMCLMERPIYWEMYL